MTALMTGTGPTSAERGLDDCGCCGTVRPGPAEPPAPGPGRPSSRSGTHATVLRRMLAALGPALPELTARATDDPTVALLDAWATVADVVTFYQERILDEGFLQTATERRSVLELARAIGYELRPGVAAAADLLVAVETVVGAPASAVLPERTQVLSVPGQGQRPQTFETGPAATALAALDARELEPGPVDETLGVLLKYQDDIAKLRGAEAARLIAEAKQAAAA